MSVLSFRRAGLIVFCGVMFAACNWSSISLGDSADTVYLTDEPGNWFRSENTGTPVSVINAGDRVDFKINNCCTSTRHTVTLLVKPPESQVVMDQDQSKKGTLSVTFDVPGVYVFVCKVHPYMTGVVAVLDETGNVPDVPAASLPFIAHLGVDALPAATVLSVMTTVAPTDQDKLAKWDILTSIDERIPSVPGIGEIWINAQFERVAGQRDEVGDEDKPGTIVVVDAATFQIEREINGLAADGKWNNPHNLWADFSLNHVYNSNWFGKWINKIHRENGQFISGINVGEAPTHIVTIPTPGSPQLGMLTVPLSADDEMVKVADTLDGLKVMAEVPTGTGRNHPHGHWLTCGNGDRAIVPNVFKGLGLDGSISIIDTESGNLLREFSYDANDPLRSALLMPIAVGECHVDGVSTAYVANLVSGMVTVIDVDRLEIITNIPVTLTPDDQTGFDLVHTLQGPIQTPVSPDEKWVATAVFSLTTVDRALTGSADHVALIDTSTNQVVAYIPTPAGTHGVNWGAKLGGGYYAYVTNQHANVLTVIDPDPNGDHNGSDAAVVGTILIANGSPDAGVTDGTGGQGIKPLPMTHDGWIQKTVALSGTGLLSPEVEGWISLLTEDQKDPRHDPDLVTAEEINVRLGIQESGELSDTFQSDDSYLCYLRGNAFAPNLPSIWLEFQGTLPNDNPATLKVILEGQVNDVGIDQGIEMFNFVTGRFEVIDIRDASVNSDHVAEVVLTEDVGRFVEMGTGRVRTKVTYIDDGTGFNLNWKACIDQFGWEMP